MSSNKRRKLNEPPQLSAFAAKGLRSHKDSPNQKSQSQVAETGKVTTGRLKEQTASSDGLNVISPKGDTALKHTIEFERQGVSSDDSERGFDSEEGALNSSFQSQAVSPGTTGAESPIILSTFRPNKRSVKPAEDRSLWLKIAPGERLVVLGQYDLYVRKGHVTLLGATLGPSARSYRVFAPSTHSLPVLRCVSTDIEDAEIRLCQSNSGISRLKSLSPLFSKIWNDDAHALGSDFASLLRRSKRSTFQILYSSKDVPQKPYLQPVVASPEWNQALSKFPTSSNQKAPVIVVCGPKGSGKSTFAKLLANRLLSPKVEGSSKIRPAKGIALLDVDPGQPEYSVQGQISLIHLKELNFGPPFTHPVVEGQGQLIRAHTVGAVTPAFDPTLYMECVLDLFSHYRNFVSTSSKCPLVINTPGWILGTGLEILVEIVAKCQPTEVIYMSQDGPQEVVETLQEAAKKTPVVTLPSQGSEYTTRTPAHLRTMQAMSYFHLKAAGQGNLSWDGSPLTSVRPWEVKYFGKDAGILGIMCYGEQPPPSLLLEAINGSVLAVIAVDEKSAIPWWEASPEDIDETEETLNDRGTSFLQPQTSKIHSPILVHTPEENIPYFNPANAISLVPQYSHCLGLALLRGIDVPRQRLQLLTPILPTIVQDINDAGKSIVLVSGKFDTPGWAYVEGLVQRDIAEKEHRKAKTKDEHDTEDTDGTDEETDHIMNHPGEKQIDSQNVPWVEKLQGSQGRGVGSRVWRVRRDLGRATDAG